MIEDYTPPGLAPLGFDFEQADRASDKASLTLSGTEVLGIVQSALAELGPASERIIAVKRDVLEKVAEGRLAEALHTAIVGAGKVD